jgi:hypothetical protein
LRSGWTSPIWSTPVRTPESESDASSVVLSISSRGALDYCNFRLRNSTLHRRRDNNHRPRCANCHSLLRFLDPRSLHPPREESRVWASSTSNYHGGETLANCRNSAQLGPFECRHLWMLVRVRYEAAPRRVRSQVPRASRRKVFPKPLSE